MTWFTDFQIGIHWLPRHGSLISRSEFIDTTRHFWSPQRSLGKYTNAYNKLSSTLNTKQNNSSIYLTIWLCKRNEKYDSALLITITVTVPSLFVGQTPSLWCNSPRHLLVLPPSVPTRRDCSSTTGAVFRWTHLSLAAPMIHLECFWLDGVP